jgi:S-adenosylmethionine/arginine decarboxylase-like enzyme
VPSPSPALTHLLVDVKGANESQLRDSTLLSGLLIAAASGAGLTALGPPVVRQTPNGDLAAVLLLEGCHIAAHALPSRGILLLDVLAPHLIDARKAVDVFVRRFGTARARIEQVTRG